MHNVTEACGRSLNFDDALDCSASIQYSQRSQEFRIAKPAHMMQLALVRLVSSTCLCTSIPVVGILHQIRALAIHVDRSSGWSFAAFWVGFSHVFRGIPSDWMGVVVLVFVV